MPSKPWLTSCACRDIVTFMAAVYSFALVVVMVAVGCYAESGLEEMPGVHSYRPAPGLEGPTRAALDRIEVATGLALASGHDGVVPVETGALEDDPSTPVDESHSCALTTRLRDRREPHVVFASSIMLARETHKVGCPELEEVILHEVIHDLRRYVATRQSDDHVALGVFAESIAPGARLTAEDLVAICEAQPCTRFVPEAQ